MMTETKGGVECRRRVGWMSGSLAATSVRWQQGMKSTLLTVALGMGACLVVGVGMFAAALVGLQMRGLFGREYELWAFWGALLVVAAIAGALYHWQDAVLGWMGPLVGRTPPEMMYCQTCGTASRHDVSFCPKCSGTRFGIAKPSGRTPGSRWHVQVGMDVLGSDGERVGVIKRKRARDFLVARPLRRDVYVPLTAIARSDKENVHLTVTTDRVETEGWAKPGLLGRTETGGETPAPRLY